MIRTFARYNRAVQAGRHFDPPLHGAGGAHGDSDPLCHRVHHRRGHTGGGHGEGVALRAGSCLRWRFSACFSGPWPGSWGPRPPRAFAANLRQEMFENIQRYSFSNIDKFSTASLVTRMTTDVTNTQMAFQMSLRIAVRAPPDAPVLHGHVLCHLPPRLSLVFLAALVVLGVVLFGVMGLTLPIFQQVFRRYDDLKRQRAGERLRHPHGEGPSSGRSSRTRNSRLRGEPL